MIYFKLGPRSYDATLGRGLDHENGGDLVRSEFMESLNGFPISALYGKPVTYIVAI